MVEAAVSETTSKEKVINSNLEEKMADTPKQVLEYKEIAITSLDKLDHKEEEIETRILHNEPPVKTLEKKTNEAIKAEVEPRKTVTRMETIPEIIQEKETSLPAVSQTVSQLSTATTQRTQKPVEDVEEGGGFFWFAAAAAIGVVAGAAYVYFKKAK